MANYYTPFSPDEVPEQLQRFCGPSAPAPARTMTARGIAPLGPADRVTALYILVGDVDVRIADVARESLAKLPTNIIEPAATGPLDPRVLGYLLLTAAPDSPLVSVLVANRATPGWAVEVLASTCDAALVDLIATNQQRIIEHPAIIRALSQNRQARRAVLESLLEFAQREGLEIPGVEPLVAAPLAVSRTALEAVVKADLPELSDEVVSGLTDAELQGLIAAAADAAVEEAATHVPTEANTTRVVVGVSEGEGDEVVEKVVEDTAVDDRIFRQILKMSVPQKVRLAIKGNLEARRLLAKETNKMVLMALVTGPRITEGEIEAMALNRALPRDVIRKIASDNQWTKSYQVRLNLIFNPKTDTQTVVKWIPVLQARDLKTLARAKSVPQTVALQARKFLHARQARQK